MVENTLMWREILEEPDALRRCVAANAEAAADFAAALKKRGVRSVMIAARGTSDHAAIYGKYVLELLWGLPVTLAAPSVLTMYRAALDLHDWAVLGISQSGATEEVAQVLRQARAQGAVTAGVTNTEGSAVAEAAEYRFFCSAGPERSVAATKTFTTELCILLLLATEISGRRDVRRELECVPDALEKVLSGGAALREAAERLHAMRNGFVLARGTQYPIALESALKIQETTYIPAKAFAISDFYHGPVAMVQQDTPVLIYGMRGPSAEEAQGVIRRLAGTGAPLFILSDDPALLEKGDAAFAIPASGSDFVTPFYTAGAAQMFACQLAVALGNDPDHPRGLNKVTTVT